MAYVFEASQHEEVFEAMASHDGVERKTIHPSAENVAVSFRFPDSKVPDGYTVDSGAVSAENNRTGADTSGDVLEDTVADVTGPDADGTFFVAARVRGGGSAFDETEHKVTVVISLSGVGDPKTFVEVFLLKVSDRVEEC